MSEPVKLDVLSLYITCIICIKALQEETGKCQFTADEHSLSYPICTTSWVKPEVEVVGCSGGY